MENVLLEIIAVLFDIIIEQRKTIKQNDKAFSSFIEDLEAVKDLLDGMESKMGFPGQETS